MTAMLDAATNSSNPNLTAPAAGVLTAFVTLVPLSFLGIITNTITISVIVISPKLKSTFNCFILSLAVSDLTSAIISTLFLYRVTIGFETWEWPEFLCRLFWAMDIWTSYVTSTHILVFSILRCVSVQWPARFKMVTLLHGKVCISLIWLVTGLVGSIPFGIWFKPVDRTKLSPSRSKLYEKWPACSLDLDHQHDFKNYTRILYPVFFYIPIIVISFLSGTIALKIFMKRKKRRSMIGSNSAAEERRQRKENQMMLQLGLIVGSFLLGYITYSVYHLTSVENLEDGDAVFDWWFGFIEYLMLRVSECLNPIFYNLASSVMRKETKAMMKRAWNIATCSAQDIIDVPANERNVKVEDEFANSE